MARERLETTIGMILPAPCPSCGKPGHKLWKRGKNGAYWCPDCEIEFDRLPSAKEMK